MQKNNGVNKEEGQIHSVFDDTLNALNFRSQFFSSNQISNEGQLLNDSTPQAPQVKSISRIIPTLAFYNIGESPLQPQLRDLYTAQYSVPLRCILPSHSDGEKSVNGDEDYEPTFKWLCSAFIESPKLEVDQIQPRKIQRGKVPEQWKNIHELLVFNIQKKIHIRQVSKELEKTLYNMFNKFSFIRVKRVKIIYFRGRPSAIIKFSEPGGSAFAYFNMIECNKMQRKQQLGQSSQIYRVLNNRLKLEQNDRWVGILFRRLPSNLSKENFITFLKKKSDPTWVEELVQIQNYKYTLCTVNFLQEAFRICQAFQVNSPFKDVKVNLHPKSKKIWSGSSPELLT